MNWAKNTSKARLAHHNKMGGYWAEIGDKIEDATKVKAHLSKDQSAAAGQAHLHKGNEIVDLLAKEAAPRYHQGDIDGYIKQIENSAKMIAKIAMRLGALIEGVGITLIPRNPNLPTVEKYRNGRSHCFQWCHSQTKWVCCDCGAWAHRRNLKQATKRTCPGPSRRIDHIHHTGCGQPGRWVNPHPYSIAADAGAMPSTSASDYKSYVQVGRITPPSGTDSWPVFTRPPRGNSTSQGG